jgi:hypothetical protein
MNCPQLAIEHHNFHYTKLFGDSFCPPGRLCGCSVSPASGAGSSTSDWGVVFVVFVMSLKGSVYRRVSNVFYYLTSSLLMILVMNFNAFVSLLGFTHCQVFPDA